MPGDYRGGVGQERAGRRGANQAESQDAAKSVRASSNEAATTDQTVEEVAATVVRLASRVADLSAAYLQTARRDAGTAREHAQNQHLQLQRQLREVAADKYSAAVTKVFVAAAAIAPGILSSTWDNLDALRQPAGMLDAASYVRAGGIRPIGSEARSLLAPLLVPLLDHGNLLVKAPGDNPSVGGVVQEVVLRSLLGTGAGQLSLATYDPHLRGTTAPFTALRQVSDELVPPTLASPEELRDLLDELSHDVRRISEMFEGVPTTLGEFRHDAGQPIERYRLVAILNYPVGFDARTHSLLRTLMRTGPTCGISFIIHYDTTVAGPNDVIPKDLYPLATVLRIGSPSTVDGMEGFHIDTGMAPSLAIIEPAIDELQERAKEVAAPRISFAELQPEPSERWQQSSAERVTAIIGMAGHQLVEVTVGDEREQRHNILVSGAVGQGKSNLLMVLVHSWAVRYSPDELELYLLDFKDGVTLFPLSPQPDHVGWLPHARVLGLESDRAYGAAVLEHLVGEFDRRAKIIRPYGDNIMRYRQVQPGATMPRIIAVIDEFQVLFEEDDELSKSALLNLERLAKKGRAYGIHLVLASQTLSGITAMLSKQDGIFAQFPIRLALKNSAQESRAVLDQQNTEAARLRYRGELIVNTDFGQSEANRRAVVALAEPAELASLRVELWRQASSYPAPAVFNGGAATDLVTTLRSIALTTDEDEPVALLGLPVAVTPKPVGVPLPAESGRHLSVIGAGDSPGGLDHSAGAVLLQSAVASLAYQHKPSSARFVILNLLAAKSKDQAVVERLAEALTALGHQANMRTTANLVETLTALNGEITLRREGASTIPTYLAAFGMDRAPNLHIPDPVTLAQPIDSLHAVWREGAALGIHVLGWWANTRSYSDQLGMEANGTIDALALLRISSQDVIDLLGPFVSWDGPTNRALLRDVAEATDPTVIVPFGDLTDDGIRHLAQSRVSR